MLDPLRQGRIGPTWRSRHSLLVFVFVAALSTNVVCVVLSPLLPAIIDDFGVFTGAIGIVLTGMWAAAALTQLPGGLLADRFGERRIILASLGITAVSGGLLALAPTLLTFAVVAVVLGAEVGFYYPAGTALLTRWVDNTGGALGVHAAAGPVGGLVAPLIATAVAVHYGWRAGVAAGAAVVLVALVMVASGIQSTPPLRPDEGPRGLGAPWALGALLRRPQVAYTTAIAFATGYAWQAFVSFFPTFLVSYHGFSAERAGLFFGVIFVFSAVGLPIVGRISDTVGRDTVMAVALGLVAAGFGLFLVSDGSYLLLGTVIVGSGMNWGGALYSRYMDAFSADERGTGFGLARSVAMLLAASGNA